MTRRPYYEPAKKFIETSGPVLPAKRKPGNDKEEALKTGHGLF